MKNAFLITFLVLVSGLALWYAVDPGTVSTGVSAAFVLIVGVCTWVANRVTTQLRSGVPGKNDGQRASKVTDKSADALSSSLRDIGHNSDELRRAIDESGTSLSELGAGIRLSARELEQLDDDVRKSEVLAQQSAGQVRELGDQLGDGKRELSGVIDIIAGRKK